MSVLAPMCFCLLPRSPHLREASAADPGLAVAEVHVQQPPGALELQVRRHGLGDVGTRAVQLRRDTRTHTRDNGKKRARKTN